MDARPSVRNISASILQKNKGKEKMKINHYTKIKNPYYLKKRIWKCQFIMAGDTDSSLKKRKAKNIFIIYVSRKLEKKYVIQQ